jgi:hypothetical protein
VVKRLFLDGITLKPSHIAKGHTEFAVPTESHFTDATSPLRDEAPVTTGKTAKTLSLPAEEAASNRMTVKHLCKPQGPSGGSVRVR